MITAAQLYGMTLHQTLLLGSNDESIRITRVPGGWLYWTSRVVAGGKVIDTQFIPYSSEFDPSGSVEELP